MGRFINRGQIFIHFMFLMSWIRNKEIEEKTERDENWWRAKSHWMGGLRPSWSCVCWEQWEKRGMAGLSAGSVVSWPGAEGRAWATGQWHTHSQSAGNQEDVKQPQSGTSESKKRELTQCCRFLIHLWMPGKIRKCWCCSENQAEWQISRQEK